MRIEFAALGLAAALFMPASAKAACSIEQRIELAKAGYDKGEVERLCAEQASAPAAQGEPERPRQRPPDEVLAAATYDADDDGPLRQFISSREKCELLPDRVRLNNSKKTFGGSASKLKDYDDFTVSEQQRLFRAERATGSVEASIRMMIWGIAPASCYALLIRRNGVAPEDFDNVEAAARAEMNDVEQALKAKGVEFD